MNLATWNIQGINTKCREVFDEMKKMRSRHRRFETDKKKEKGMNK